jgi:hypothetical protein
MPHFAKVILSYYFVFILTFLNDSVFHSQEKKGENVKKSISDDVLTDFIPKFGTPGSETSYSNTDPDQYPLPC